MSTQKPGGSQLVIELVAAVVAIAISWHVVAKLSFVDNIVLGIALSLPALAKKIWPTLVTTWKRGQDSKASPLTKLRDEEKEVA